LNAIKHYRKKAGLTQPDLAEKSGLSIVTISRYESGHREPRASDIQKLCEVLGVGESELLNGPEKQEIEIRIVIRESDEEVGNVTIDMSKDAPLVQMVQVGPHKTAITLTFGPEKSLRDVCAELMASEDKYEAARAAIYGA